MFNDGFDTRQKMLNGLISYSQKNGVVKDNKSFELSADWLCLQMKAQMARQLYTNTDFWKIINKKDNTFTSAIEIINSNKLNAILTK